MSLLKHRHVTVEERLDELAGTPENWHHDVEGAKKLNAEVLSIARTLLERPDIPTPEDIGMTTEGGLEMDWPNVFLTISVENEKVEYWLSLAPHRETKTAAYVSEQVFTADVKHFLSQ